MQAFILTAINNIKNQPIQFIIMLNIFMLIASYTDLKDMKIYDKFNLFMLGTRIGTFISMAINNKITFGEFMGYVGGAVLMFLLFLIPAMITLDSIGGDIKFAFNVGLWIGVHGALLVGLIGSVTNFLFRIFFVGKKDKEPYFKVFMNVPITFMAKKILPLAPFFYLGYLILLIAGFVI